MIVQELAQQAFLIVSETENVQDPPPGSPYLLRANEHRHALHAPDVHSAIEDSLVR